MRSFSKRMVAAVLLAVPFAALSTDEGDIKYRQALMKSNAGHAGAIAEIARGNVDHTDALQVHANALLDLSRMVPSAFKNKTSGESRAKAEVWSDFSGFKAKAGDFETAAMAVADAAKRGPDAVKAKLGDLFDTCKACHKNYREKE